MCFFHPVALAMHSRNNPGHQNSRNNNTSPSITLLLEFWRGIPARRFRTRMLDRRRKLGALIQCFKVRRALRAADKIKHLFVAGCLFIKLSIRDWWLNHCATVVQTMWRAKLARRNFYKILLHRRRQRSALRIQRHIRRLLAMRRADRLRFQVLYMFSARLIQAKIRQYLSARTLYCVALVEKYSDSVLVLQRAWRGFRDRRWFKSRIGLRMLVVRIKALWVEGEKHCVRMQSLFRGWRDRHRMPEKVGVWLCQVSDTSEKVLGRAEVSKGRPRAQVGASRPANCQIQRDPRFGKSSSSSVHQQQGLRYSGFCPTADRVPTSFRELDPDDGVCVECVDCGLFHHSKIPHTPAQFFRDPAAHADPHAAPPQMAYLRDCRVRIKKHFFFYRRAVLIQKTWRRKMTRLRYKQLRLNSVIIQTYLRTAIWRRWFVSVKASANILQKHWRKWWLSQTERMAKEAAKANFDADGEVGDSDEEGGMMAATEGSTQKAMKNVLFGRFLMIGLQGRSRTRLGSLRGTLDRIHMSGRFVVLAVALGSAESLVVCEDKTAV